MCVCVCLSLLHLGILQGQQTWLATRREQHRGGFSFLGKEEEELLRFACDQQQGWMDGRGAGLS